jgi:hypothetical protein
MCISDIMEGKHVIQMLSFEGLSIALREPQETIDG